MTDFGSTAGDKIWLSPDELKADRKMTMVERVAKAIYDCHQTIVPTSTKWEELTESRHRKAWFEYARAAIAAMRDPTHAMLLKGSDQLGKPKKSLPQCWRDMIDAALKE